MTNRAFVIQAAVVNGKYVPFWELTWTNDGWKHPDSYSKIHNLSEVHWDAGTKSVVFPVVVEVKEPHTRNVGDEVYYEPGFRFGMHKIRKSKIAELEYKESSRSTSKISKLESYEKVLLTEEQLKMKDSIVLFINYSPVYKMENGEVVDGMYIRDLV